jgi:hypothetical protein
MAAAPSTTAPPAMDDPLDGVEDKVSFDPLHTTDFISEKDARIAF